MWLEPFCKSWRMCETLWEIYIIVGFGYQQTKETAAMKTDPAFYKS